MGFDQKLFGWIKNGTLSFSSFIYLFLFKIDFWGSKKRFFYFFFFISENMTGFNVANSHFLVLFILSSKHVEEYISFSCYWSDFFSCNIWSISLIMFFQILSTDKNKDSQGLLNTQFNFVLSDFEWQNYLYAYYRVHYIPLAVNCISALIL